MIDLKLEDLNKVIEIDEQFLTIRVENIEYYKKLYFNYESLILFYKDIKLIPYKEINVIKNPLELNLDEKKIINKLYSYLMKFSNNETNDKLSMIDKLIIELISILEENTNFNLEYNDTVTIDQILSIYKVKVDDKSFGGDYLEKIIAFLKFNHEVMNYNLFLFFGLQHYLSKDELKVLKHEILSYDLKIIDIMIYNTNLSDFDLIIDNDMCII